MLRFIDRGPLDTPYTVHVPGMTITVTLSARKLQGQHVLHVIEDEIQSFDEEPDWDGERYDPALSIDQARWRPPPDDPVEAELARW